MRRHDTTQPAAAAAAAAAVRRLRARMQHSCTDLPTRAPCAVRRAPPPPPPPPPPTQDATLVSYLRTGYETTGMNGSPQPSDENETTMRR